MHLVGTWFESRAENGPYLLEIFSRNTSRLYRRFSVRTPAIFTGDFQPEYQPPLLEIFSQESGIFTRALLLDIFIIFLY